MLSKKEETRGYWLQRWDKMVMIEVQKLLLADLLTLVLMSMLVDCSQLLKKLLDKQLTMMFTLSEQAVLQLAITRLSQL